MEIDKHLEDLKIKIEELLKENKVTLIPRLHITNQGILPVIAFESIEPKSDIVIPKSELLIPK